MARSRNIKPSFFENETLAELPLECRLLFIGLWGLADREGRLEDRPRRIKAKVFPYDDFDAEALLHQLEKSEGNFILRYEVAGTRYIQIINFKKHQNPHKNEAQSTIPPPPTDDDAPEKHSTSTVQKQFINGKSTVALALIPDSPNLIPDCCTEPEATGPVNASKRSPEQPRPPNGEEEPVYSLILNDGSAHGVTQAEFDRYCELYPAIDVMQELRKMAGWLEANPAKRKTGRGIRKFINNWLSGAQDRSRDIRGAPQETNRQYRFFSEGG